MFARTIQSLTRLHVPDAERARLTADITECLRTYDTLGLWRDAEDVLRREVVREFVKKVWILRIRESCGEVDTNLLDDPPRRALRPTLSPCSIHSSPSILIRPIIIYRPALRPSPNTIHSLYDSGRFAPAFCPSP